MTTEWRYVERGMARHALPFSESPRAACGLELVRSEDWRGTGSQAEYDRVAVLPKCRNCVKSLGSK